MIHVNLNEEKILRYKISDSSTIKSVHLVITFPSNILFTFNEKIDTYTSLSNADTLTKQYSEITLKFIGSIINNSVEVKLPILKDTIQKPVDVDSYIELSDGIRFYRIAKDVISFYFAKLTPLTFHSPEKESFEVSYLNTDEVLFDPKDNPKRKVRYDYLIKNKK
jgi:hypothetical protein